MPCLYVAVDMTRMCACQQAGGLARGPAGHDAYVCACVFDFCTVCLCAMTQVQLAANNFPLDPKLLDNNSTSRDPIITSVTGCAAASGKITACCGSTEGAEILAVVYRQDQLPKGLYRPAQSSAVRNLLSEPPLSDTNKDNVSKMWNKTFDNMFKARAYILSHNQMVKVAKANTSNVLSLSATDREMVVMPMSWKPSRTGHHPQANTDQHYWECSPKPTFVYVYVHNCKGPGKGGPMLVMASVAPTQNLDVEEEEQHPTNPCFGKNFDIDVSLTLLGIVMLGIGFLVFMVLPYAAKAISWVWAKCCGHGEAR